MGSPQGSRGPLTVAAALVLTAGVAILGLADGGSQPGEGGTAGAGRAGTGPVLGSQQGVGAPDRPGGRRAVVLHPILAQFLDAVKRSDAPATRRLAGELRRVLREDARVLSAVGELLLDPRRSDRLRGALALVLGTLDQDRAREYLLEAARAPELGGELAKWLLYGLGAWKGRETFDDRFAFQPDGPWVVESPAGLRLPVRCRIEDPAVLALVETYLRDAGDGGIRRVALDVLRHSLDAERVRSAFLDVLGSESESGTRAACAEALGQWTLTSAADRATTLMIRDRLLGQAALPGRELLRIRLEPVLSSARLTAAEADEIAGLFAVSEGDFGFRHFLIAVAGVQAPMLLENPRTRARGERLQGLLVRMLKSESHAKLREVAAEQLGGIPNLSARRALLDAAKLDSAWHVRLAAVRSLRRMPPADDTLRAALERVASRDPDARVRMAARAGL